MPDYSIEKLVKELESESRGLNVRQTDGVLYVGCPGAGETMLSSSVVYLPDLDKREPELHITKIVPSKRFLMRAEAVLPDIPGGITGIMTRYNPAVDLLPLNELPTYTVEDLSHGSITIGPRDNPIVKEGEIYVLYELRSRADEHEIGVHGPSDEAIVSMVPGVEKTDENYVLEYPKMVPITLSGEPYVKSGINDIIIRIINPDGHSDFLKNHVVKNLPITGNFDVMTPNGIIEVSPCDGARTSINGLYRFDEPPTIQESADIIEKYVKAFYGLSVRIQQE